MKRELKVFGLSYCGRQRMIVAAKTITEAARSTKQSLYSFKQYASQTGDPLELEVAMSAPGLVFIAHDNDPRVATDFTWWNRQS